MNTPTRAKKKRNKAAEGKESKQTEKAQTSTGSRASEEHAERQTSEGRNLDNASDIMQPIKRSEASPRKVTTADITIGKEGGREGGEQGRRKGLGGWRGGGVEGWRERGREGEKRERKCITIVLHYATKLASQR